MRFMPDEPEERPRAWMRLDWSGTEMRKTLRAVYTFRSKALHAGTPFPAPMCQAPFRFAPDEAPSEIPLGLAMAAQGGTWKVKDTRILLHTFEYMARGIILNWWRAMLPDGPKRPS